MENPGVLLTVGVITVVAFLLFRHSRLFYTVPLCLLVFNLDILANMLLGPVVLSAENTPNLNVNRISPTPHFLVAVMVVCEDTHELDLSNIS